MKDSLIENKKPDRIVAHEVKPRWSIRIKFLAVTTLLLLLCVAAYLGLASTIFRNDKEELVFDLNRSLVTNLASDISAVFSGVSDKMEIFALIADRSRGRNTAVVQDLLAKDPDLIHVSVRQAAASEMDRTFTNDVFLQTWTLDATWFLTHLEQQRPVPVERILSQGEAVWNATVADGPALIGYGRRIVEEADNGVAVAHYAVIAYLKSDRILKALNLGAVSEVFVVNEEGSLLAHSDEARLAANESLRETPLVGRALANTATTSVLRFNQNDEEFLGAFAHGFGGRVLVLAQTSGRHAFAAVQRLLTRSLVFGTTLVTLAFIAAVFFARSLTRPLDILVGGMRKVSEGDLQTRIEVKSADEIATLAASFNSMIEDLRESRDQLEEINRDLEYKVRERTQKLEEQNRAVKSAQEALLRTTRLAAVGEIAGRAAHEVLNPLTSLIARVQRVQKRLRDEVGRETGLFEEIQGAWIEDFQAGGFPKLVEKWQAPSTVIENASLWQEDMENLLQIRSALEKERQKLEEDTEFLLGESQRISKIVQSMRSLSVVRSERSRLGGHEVIRESANIMADLFLQDNIRLELRLDADDDRIEVDRDELIQSLTNLLRNSLQAISAVRSGSGEGFVELRTSNENGRLCIDIADNGVGIKNEDQSKLFENQFSTKPREQGTGLGLSISRRFLRAVGGDIRLLESTPGQGAVFRVEIPLAAFSEESEEEVAA